MTKINVTNRLRKLLILGLLFVAAVAAEAAPYEKVPELETAASAIDNGDYEGALQIYRGLVKSNPGTQLSGLAQLQIYFVHRDLGESQAAAATLETLVREFRGTPIGYFGELAQIDDDFENDFSSWLSSFGSLHLTLWSLALVDRGAS